MTQTWYPIAKAEFRVMTSSLKAHRRLATASFLVLGLLWALYLAPLAISLLLQALLAQPLIQGLLMGIFPGLMRALMFFLWVMLLITPLSRALQEIKVGQWELLLSKNVKTRDILIGGFLGKLPLYGAVTLFIAPLVLVPFILVFQVALIGQLLMYAVLFVMVLTTIWLSNFLSAAIQAKLGDSPRGDDLAKGLGFLLAIVAILPMYGLMFFAPQLSAFLGLNVFLVLPCTWPADLVSWSAILFNGIGLSSPQIQVLRGTLQLDAVATGALMGVFTLCSTVLALLTADRVYAYRLGARTERVTTVSRDNFVLRGIRRLSPGSFGTLVAVSFKDLFRKAQNLSKIAYGLVLAVVLPFILSAFAALEDKLEAAAFALSPEMLVFIGGLGMTILGSITFVGTSFIESKDQLWIIQSASRGVVRYVKARLACAFLVAIPLTVLPITLITVITGAGPAFYLVMLLYGYVVQCSAIMFSTGITAMNPDYENMKSPAYQMNTILAMMVPEVAMLSPMFVVILGDILNAPVLGAVMLPVRILGPMLGFAIISAIPLLLLGGFTVLIGAKRLSRPDD